MKFNLIYRIKTIILKNLFEKENFEKQILLCKLVSKIKTFINNLYNKQLYKFYLNWVNIISAYLKQIDSNCNTYLYYNYYQYLYF